MALCYACITPEKLIGGLGIGCVCRFWRTEVPEMPIFSVATDLSHPFLLARIPTDPFVSARIVLTPSLIRIILRRRRFAQIVEPIVIAYAVLVVELTDWPCPMNIE